MSARATALRRRYRQGRAAPATGRRRGMKQYVPKSTLDDDALTRTRGIRSASASSMKQDRRRRPHELSRDLLPDRDEVDRLDPGTRIAGPSAPTRLSPLSVALSAQCMPYPSRSTQPASHRDTVSHSGVRRDAVAGHQHQFRILVEGDGETRPRRRSDPGAAPAGCFSACSSAAPLRPERIAEPPDHRRCGGRSAC